MDNKINVKDAVRLYLDQMEAEGKPVPSLRAIRAGIGGRGSMETISMAVRAWRCSRLQTEGALPDGFSEPVGKEILSVLWQSVMPVMQQHIDTIRSEADNRIAIELKETKKLSDMAADTMAEAKLREERIAECQTRIQQLHTELAKAQGSQQMAETTIAQLRLENEQLRQDLAKAVSEATKAQASADAMRKMLPFLDPKHLAGQAAKGWK